MVRRRLTVLAAAVAAIAALSACSSPDLLMNAAKKEAATSLGMCLSVESAAPSNDASNVSPNAVIRVDFDRALDTGTIVAANIVILPSAQAGNPGAAISWIYSYDNALKRLLITPAMLEGGTSYLITIGTGLHSATGESLWEDYSWNFSTANLPGGTIKIDNGAAYSTNDTGAATLYIYANALVEEYFYSETQSDVTNTHGWYPFTAPTTAMLPAFGVDGTHTVYYQFRSDAPALAVSDILSTSIILDRIHPATPTYTTWPSSATHRPTWVWAKTGSDGNGVFIYTADGAASAETTATSYTPPSPGLADGLHTFNVKERDDAGNWSITPATANVTIAAPPNPPVVSGTSPTVDTTPTWSWVSGGFGLGTFRYQLDSTSGSWTVDASPYTPNIDLSDGLHTLYVQESDGAWSESGSKEILVSPVLPISGSTDVSTKPTLRWRSGGSKGITYNIQLVKYAAAWPETYYASTTSTSYTCTTALSTLTKYKWRVKYTDLGTNYTVPSSAGATFTTGRFLKF